MLRFRITVTVSFRVTGFVFKVRVSVWVMARVSVIG